MSRKRYLLATASSVAVAAAGGAQAADMAVKSPPPSPTPVAAPSWAGFYVGGNIGAAWQKMSADPVSPYGTYQVNHGAPTSQNFNNVIGGLEIGYNWQTGTFVYGLEADLSWLSGSHSNTVIGGGTNCDVNCGVSTSMNWLDTVRARAGFALNNNWLLYGTGGVAFAKVQNSFNFGDSSALSFVNNKSVTKTLTGWVAGGGIEYMISPHVIVGGEVLYVGLPSTSVVQNNPGNQTKTTTFKNNLVIGRLKMDYKF